MGESNNRYISFLFHMYQPPWQYPQVLEQITKECYLWFTKWLSEQKDFKVTVNLNYSLTELLIKNHLDDVIDNIGRGMEKGTIELTGSAAYHAILPLIPESEAKRQIELNEKGNESVFKGVWKPKGFFPPEMAYSPEISKIVKEMGYKWLMTEEIVYNSTGKTIIPSNNISTIHALPIFFRSNFWSNEFALKMPARGDPNAVDFVRRLHSGTPENSYTILAFDMETIGHHHPEHPYNIDTMGYLANAMAEEGISVVCISQLLAEFPQRICLDMGGSRQYKGTWSTTKEDIANNIPYPLWQNPTNPIHTIQWQLIGHAIDTVTNSKCSGNYELARNLLDKGLNSCQFWWADPQRWKKPEYIIDGGKDLYDSIIMLQGIPPEKKEKAEQLFQQLKAKVYEIDAQIKKAD